MTETKFRVYLRFRESNDEAADILVQKKTILTMNPKTNTMVAFNFDEVFNAETSQEKIFQTLTEPLLESLIINGENCLLFAYGVTGAGKTHTISGTPQYPGIIPRLFNVLFGIIKNYQFNNENITIENNMLFLNDDHNVQVFDWKLLNRKQKREHLNLLEQWNEHLNKEYSSKTIQHDTGYVRYYVYMNYIEIYNTQVYDLLRFTKDTILQIPQKSLNIRTDENGRKYVMSSQYVRIDNARDAMKFYLLGHLNRHSGSTNLNMNSSRSHCILNIRLVKVQGNKQLRVRESDFTIVDLAGIERLSRTDNQGVTITETNNINKSLLALRKCFQARQMINCDNHKISCSSAIRESRLTWSLSHLLENAKTNITMIVCMHPSSFDFADNFNVLEFAKQCVDIDWDYFSKALGFDDISKEIIWNLPNWNVREDNNEYDSLIMKDNKKIQNQNDVRIVSNQTKNNFKNFLFKAKFKSFNEDGKNDNSLSKHNKNNNNSVFERLYKPKFTNKKYEFNRNNKNNQNKTTRRLDSRMIKGESMSVLRQKLANVSSRISTTFRGVKQKAKKLTNLIRSNNKKIQIQIQKTPKINKINSLHTPVINRNTINFVQNNVKQIQTLQITPNVKNKINMIYKSIKYKIINRLNDNMNIYKLESINESDEDIDKTRIIDKNRDQSTDDSSLSSISIEETCTDSET